MIQTVEKKNNSIENNFIYLVTYKDGSIWSVPNDTANKDYQEILEWVANGGTIVDNGE
jgi:hypothetical protein